MAVRAMRRDQQNASLAQPRPPSVTIVPLVRNHPQRFLPWRPAREYHLGLIYQKVQKPVLAKASFQRALEIDPKLKQADGPRIQRPLLACRDSTLARR
jgi:hypothetical protein